MRLPIGNQKQLNEQIFFVGDRVSAFGLLGNVTQTEQPIVSSCQLTVEVTFDDGKEEWFTWDGKLEARHVLPCLTMVRANHV